MTTADSPPTDFVPLDIDAENWAELEPLYTALLERELMCEGCLETLLLDRSELDASVREASANLYIRMTCDTTNKAASDAYAAFVKNVEPQLKRTSFALDKKIVESPHREKLDQDRYGVMLRDLVADVELFRENNIPLQTEDTMLGQEYSQICGKMNVMFRGEEKTLPEMGTFLEVTDRATREEAWRGVTERRHQDHEALSRIFDKMVGLRHKISLEAGFDNYRDYMFRARHRFDYGPDACEAFHRAAEEVCVPIYRKLNAERANALGVDVLRPWDLGVDPLGRPPLRPFENADELVEKCSTLFQRLDPKLGRLFETLRDGESLDLASRKGKAPGGYQENRDRSRKPFIFMNAAGMQRDLETMIHESGHAFHAILASSEPLLHYRHPPIEFCEVASMSMELMAMPYLDVFYEKKEEAARARRGALEEIARLISWVATVDAFQHWIYVNPTHSHEERAQKWIELNDRFGPAVSWDGLEHSRPTSWHRQLHLFEVPFYYIEYGIAQLGALQLWLQSREDESGAIRNYEKAMKIGGARPLPQLFEAADLVFDFGPGTVSRLMDAVQEELDALPV